MAQPPSTYHHHQPPSSASTSTDPHPDPTSTLVSLSALDFLLIELVPMAYRIAFDLAAREEAWLMNNGSSSTSAAAISKGREDDVDGGGGRGARAGGGGGGGASSLSGAGERTAGPATTTVMDEEEAREAVFHRLESLGYRVGLGIVERVSRNTPRPTTPLDTIKFLCKDLWTLLFRKQIDNLKTNHRGIYVLTDHSFKPLSRMSFDTRRPPPVAASASAAAQAQLPAPNAATSTTTATPDPASSTTGLGALGLGAGAGGAVVPVPSGFVGPQGLAQVQPFLYFPAGLIRGCLASLGIQASVTAECTGLPGATFQIRTVGAKA
ncbi:transport protein particle component [Westerdykella ornata]|uniref:Transport protein particle component n=1 Tax=Westerdykella ornata TaxID=318751 RepID=A0A6A6JDR9_WESOR|nr:transport protein particle component [Westerdykella ornata]KAF2273786.1 transport protein particle component [Westerdykella ornata]